MTSSSPITITLPRPLFCPFPPQLNPHTAEAENHNCLFLRRFGLLSSDKKVAEYKKQGVAYMTGRMFPHADVKLLCAINDFNALLFLIDDEVDNLNDPRQQVDLPRFIEGVMHTLKYHQADNETFSALDDIWLRLQEYGSKTWQAAFIENIRLMFDALIWKQKSTRSNTLPSLTDYIKHRQYFGAANIATNTLELVDNIQLDRTVFAHPDVEALTILMRNLACWANDLFSLSKELQQNEYYNLVLIIKRERQLTLTEAIEDVIELHDRQMRDFITLSRQRPSLSSRAEDAELQRYITGLQTIMRANIDWSDHETNRYSYRYAST